MSRGCNALVQEPPVDVTDAVFQEMSSKHPAEREGDVARVAALRMIAPAAAMQTDREAVGKALASFPRLSAAGPTGLRAQHVKEALAPGVRDELLRHVTDLVNILARGQAPLEAQSWLCGASLVALPKPGGDLRPIAVGETWRRLTSKVLATGTAGEMRGFLEPVQVGVGTRGGAEATVHVARQWLHRNREAPNKVFLTMDLENAFNSLDRSAFLGAVRRVSPGMAPWVDFCYKRPSHLFLGDRRLTSARGVQQGDPLGPALFAMALHGAVLAARQEAERLHPGKLDFTAFYLDDGVVAGDAAAVSAFLITFQREASALGLSLVADKCKLAPAAGDACAAGRDLFPGCDWRSDRCIKLLGAPLGGADFCAQHTGQRVAKAQILLTKIGSYGHTQGALLLLRHCASWSKLVYSARTVPPDLVTAGLSDLQASLRAALEQLAGDSIPECSWLLAQLGITQGGLGIRDPVAHAPCAYLASLASTRELCMALDAAFDPDDHAGGSGRAQAEARLRASVMEAASFSRGDASPLSQKELSSLVDAAKRQLLLQGQQGDVFFRTHVALCSVPGAGAWLTAPPANDGREMDPPLFRVALRRRLRAPVYDTDGHCPSCGQPLDRWGDHALVCACSGDRTIRHNAVRNIVFAESMAGGLRPEKEKGGLLPDRPGTDGLPSGLGRRPADLWLPRGMSGQGEALDFAVTSGMRADVFRVAAVSPETVFHRYERHKREYKHTADSCEAAGFRFTPMVLEAHGGGWSSLARGTFDWIARQTAAVQFEDPSTTALKMAQRISVSLHRENARAILKRAVVLEGRAQPGGWDDPGDEWQ